VYSHGIPRVHIEAQTLRRGATAFKTQLGRVVASQSGRAVVNRLVLEAARRSAQVGGCRSGLVGASQLGQEGAYRSVLAAGSPPIGIGAADSIQGKYPPVMAFSLEHSRSEKKLRY
jgi:hypothetical protein